MGIPRQEKKILLTGIKPSGILHIGNYFGAINPLLERERDSAFKVFAFIADFHALTTLQNREELRENILSVVAGYIACGLDPEKILFYKQSDVPEVTELAWVFECITTMPYLMRAHAFKDAEAKNKEINAGLFNYPLLMAADILIQRASIIPVGLDQKQHLEIARDTAEKFNRIFGEAFPVPEPLISEETGVVPGIDGRKMSKSYGNTIPLFASPEEIEEIVMSIPTDSTKKGEPLDPEKDRLFSYHRLFSKAELASIESRYLDGSIGYKESKEMLIENLKKFLNPLRKRHFALLENEADLIEMLEEGGERARARAHETITLVRKLIGVSL